MNYSNLFRAFLAALLLLSAGAYSAADDGPVPRIMATGEGSISMAPDMAIVSLTVTREAKTARAALDANSTAMAQVITAMGEYDIADKDMQTTGFSIQPRYIYPKNRGETPPTIAAYTVRNSLTVKVRELVNLGALLDRSVSLGVNEGGNVRFGNDDPSQALAQARAEAVKDALARVATIAQAAGVKTAGVLEISEHQGRSGPRPLMMESMAMGRSADAVPVAAGESSYTVTVNVSVSIAE